MENPRWGTEIGRLFLAGRIDAPMATAGERWAELAARYRAAIDSPPVLRSTALERGSLAAPPDPDSDEGLRQAARDITATLNMQEAHAVLCGAGKLAERVVRAVCERGEAAADFDLSPLARGLGFLAEFWGLTENSRMRRNGR